MLTRFVEAEVRGADLALRILDPSSPAPHDGRGGALLTRIPSRYIADSPRRRSLRSIRLDGSSQALSSEDPPSRTSTSSSAAARYEPAMTPNATG